MANLSTAGDDDAASACALQSDNT
jgi:hypothetical protein